MAQRRKFIVWGLGLLISVMISIYCWYEAARPMTSERYARFCGQSSECYPELTFLFASVVAGLIAVAAALKLLFAGVRRWTAIHQ